MKKFLLLIILFLSFSLNVRAVECSNTELANVRSLASAIKFEMKYIGSKSDDEYGILVSGMSDGFVVSIDNRYYYNNDLIDGLSSNKTYKLSVIYYQNIECSNAIGYSRYITIPSYNKYYKTEICENNSSIEYCQITYDSSSLSEEEFNNMVLKYLDSQNISPVKLNGNNNIILFVVIGAISVTFVIVLFRFVFKKSKHYD